MRATNPTEFENLMIDFYKKSKSTTSGDVLKSLIEFQNKLTIGKQYFDAKADSKKQDSKVILKVKYKTCRSYFQIKEKVI